MRGLVSVILAVFSNGVVESRCCSIWRSEVVSYHMIYILTSSEIV
jgi:hypothetical protein